MRKRRVMMVLTLAFAMADATAAPPRSNEPFTSFRAIDKQLSVINERGAKLQPGAARAERIQSIRAVRAAIAKIRQRTQRLTSLYRARHERFGVKMFRALDQKALALSKSLTSVQGTRKDAERDRAFERFNQATLNLVLQFQAISANYGANHCAAGQWACCEPKKNPETNRGPAEGCKWACASRRQSCGGFLGPRTTRPMSR